MCKDDRLKSVHLKRHQAENIEADPAGHGYGLEDAGRVIFSPITIRPGRFGRTQFWGYVRDRVVRVIGSANQKLSSYGVVTAHRHRLPKDSDHCPDGCVTK
jgi:hypothetical protein